MNIKQILARPFPKKTFTLLGGKGSVSGIKNNYLDEGHPPTICGEHIVLANMVKELVTDEKVKHILLTEIDIVYDMGKRMGNKLVDYYKKSNEHNGWREGF